MRKQYDFSVARKNPYATQLKKPVTIRLDQDSITYFKSMAEETGIPYQSLISRYLKEGASLGKKLDLARSQSNFVVALGAFATPLPTVNFPAGAARFHHDRRSFATFADPTGLCSLQHRARAKR